MDQVQGGRKRLEREDDPEEESSHGGGGGDGDPSESGGGGGLTEKDDSLSSSSSLVDSNLDDLDSSRSHFSQKTLDVRAVEERARLKMTRTSARAPMAKAVAPPPAPYSEPASVPQVPAMANIPRQWQMSELESEMCLFDYSCWKERFVAFKAMPSPDTDRLHELPDLEERLTELKYLASELYAVWGNGCTTIPANRPAAFTKRILADRQKLGLAPDGPIKTDPMAIAYCIFFKSIKKVELSPHLVETAFDSVNADVLAMVMLFGHYKCVNKTPESIECMSKLHSVQTAVVNAYHMLQHAVALSIAIDPNKSAITPSKRVLYYVENFNHIHARMEDAKPLAKFLMFLIEAAQQKRYRRYRGGVYEEYYTPDGYATSFWMKKSTIQEFIAKEAGRLANHDMWKLGLERGNFKQAEAYLETYHDHAFPFLKLDRHVFSYRNGIYFAATRKFRAYNEGKVNWGADTAVESRSDDLKRGPQTGIDMKSLEGKLMTNASANFFDLDFVDHEKVSPDISWWDIPTPALSKIFNDQHIPVDAQKIAFAMLGRLLYDTGEMDGWEVIMWILGRAGSGKSTLCKIAQLFYQDEDVAVISNNIEEQFGLDSVYDKLIFAAPEVKKDFRLSQAEFQMIVSGERMSIARKFQKAAQVLFKVPGIVAGNDMPAWMDNSNSVARRLMLLLFNIALKKQDGSIYAQLRNEIAFIMSKCNQAYHLLVKQCGKDSLWDHVPDYFLKTQNQLKAKTHPVYHFLNSEDLDFAPGNMMPLDTFRTMFLLHCQKCSLKRVPWNEELYMVPFADRKLSLELREEIQWPPGTTDSYKNCTVITGVTVKEGRFGGQPGHNPNPYRQQQPQQQQQGTPQKTASAAAPGPMPSSFTTYKAIPTFKK